MYVDESFLDENVCPFNLTASSTNYSPSAGATITLNSGCTGDCSGTISYSWKLNATVVSTAQNPSIKVPDAAGTYVYIVTATKSGCSKTSSVTITVGNPSVAGCFTLKLASNNKLLTNVNGVVKIKDASNTSSQIWKIEPSGNYVRVIADDGRVLGVANGGNSIGDLITNGPGAFRPVTQCVANGGNSIGDLITLQASGIDAHLLWTKTSLTGEHVGKDVFIRKESALRFGSTENWGNGVADDNITDIRLSSDPDNIYGANKWILQSTSCTVNPCDFNITASNTNSNPSANQPLQLNYGCSGNDCGGVSYAWSGNGISGSTSPLNINAPGSPGTYAYTVTAAKSGCSSKTASTSITIGTVTGPTTCVNLGDQCSGNSSEIRSYSVNMPSGGSSPLKLTYRAHEGPSIGRMRINGGSWQTFNLAQTGASQYVETTIGNFPLNSGNNTIEFASGGGYQCYRQLCAGTGTTTPPSCDFNVSAGNTNGNPSPNQALQLNYVCSGANCSGVTYSWSGNGTSGSTSPLNINAPGSSGTYTYTVTAAKSGCSNKAASTSITVGTVSGNFNQCLESESSGGNGPITSDPNASNGQTRGAENNYNHYVDYALTGVPTAGTYYVKLRYYSASAPVVTVSVNGGSAQTVNLASSGSWNIAWTEHRLPVSLAAGNNTIRIQGAGGGSCRQDKICVSNSATARLGSEESVLVQQEEKALLVSPNPNPGTFEVNFYLEKGKKAMLTVMDSQGRSWFEQEVTGKGSHKEKIKLAGHLSGTFLVQVRKENGAEIKKVIVVH